MKPDEADPLFHFCKLCDERLKQNLKKGYTTCVNHITKSAKHNDYNWREELDRALTMDSKAEGSMFSYITHKYFILNLSRMSLRDCSVTQSWLWHRSTDVWIHIVWNPCYFWNATIFCGMPQLFKKLSVQIQTLKMKTRRRMTTRWFVSQLRLIEACSIQYSTRCVLFNSC